MFPTMYLSLPPQGLDSGFAGGEDETNNVYDKPFRSGRDMAQHIYRPSKNIDKDAYADDFENLTKNNRCVCVTRMILRSWVKKAL